MKTGLFKPISALLMTAFACFLHTVLHTPRIVLLRLSRFIEFPCHGQGRDGPFPNMSFPSLKKKTEFLAVIAGCTLMGSLALAQEKSPAPEHETAGSKNLLSNGDFTNGTEGWEFHAYEQRGKMSIDENEKHGNKPSVRVDHIGEDTSKLKQTVTVEPETRYRLEGYIKTKDLQPVTREGKGGAGLFLDGTRQNSQVVNKTKSWTKVSVIIVTGAQTEVQVGGNLTSVTGTAWFADLSMVKIGKAPPRR